MAELKLVRVEYGPPNPSLVCPFPVVGLFKQTASPVLPAVQYRICSLTMEGATVTEDVQTAFEALAAVDTNTIAWDE